MSLTWPDLAIGALLLVLALRGWKRGFVLELAGAIALAIAVIAAIRYPGSLDDIAANVLHASPGVAHVVGMTAFALAAYIAVRAIAAIFERFARLPLISLGNRIGGAAIGGAKALAIAWAVLYVALFFPLGHDLRTDLRRSTLVSIVTSPDERVDELMRGALPTVVRPLVDPVFLNHHV